MKHLGLKGFLVLCFVFIPLEGLFALHKEQKIFRKGWFNDLIHLFVNQFLVNLGLLIVLGGLLITSDYLVSHRLQEAVARQPRWLQFIEAVFVADLGFYTAHRLAHAVPWLWRFHAVHHSVEEMDWLASARLHPFDQILGKTMTILPLYILGFSKATFGFYLGLAAFQAVFIHANVRFKFGPLRWLMATPEFHHWHHSNQPESYNKNFAGQLPWLDWLFGTLHMPNGRMPEKYGINESIPNNYASQILYPFRSAGTETPSKPADSV
jgi:sterol desaturase/sphingolipid hydroxylase (fatty acid hydroxylase superfamily)